MSEPKPVYTADKGQEALALWQEWFETDGDPSELGHDGYYLADFCFFCGVGNPTLNGHTNDCIYIRAKRLLGKEFNGLKLVGAIEPSP